MVSIDGKLSSGIDYLAIKASKTPAASTRAMLPLYIFETSKPFYLLPSSFLDVLESW